MNRKLLMTAAFVAIALTPSIGIGPAAAHGGGFHGGVFHDRSFFGRRGVEGDGFGNGGLFGGYYPGYYAYGQCYLTVYGATYCH